MAYPEISGYTIQRELGRGGMGIAYLALDTGLHREVAIKLLKADDLAELSAAQLQREAKLMAKLEHPGIVPIYAQGQIGNNYYLVMRYLPGGTLKQRLEACGGLGLEAATALLIPLLEALAYAHQVGVLHRDIKPANILLGQDGKPHLVDFGIAKLLHSDPTRPTQGGMKGTPVYMSPEQVQGHALDGRSDLYSLGVVYYELLTGQPPFVTADPQANPIAVIFKHLTEPAPRLPEPLAAAKGILDKLLAKDPKDRYADAGEALAAVRGLNSMAVTPPESQATAELLARERAALAQERQRADAAEAKLRTLEQASVKSPAQAQTATATPKAAPSKRNHGAALALAVLLAVGGLVGWWQVSAEAERQAQIERVLPELAANMVQIPKGCFEMGSPANEKGRDDDEGPQHRVCIEQPFYLGKTEVTQAQWEAVMGNNPSRFKGANRPVENVSWDDIQEFIRKLNAQTGKQYGLPSEAQWEYAARAGTKTAYYFGDDASQLGRYAWFDGNSGNQTHPVGEKLPNAFGLHDLHGNVWEWVQDCWHGNYVGAPTDGGAWETSCSGDSRVLRGGSWYDSPGNLRSAYRNSLTPGYRAFNDGFRLAASS